MFGLGGAGPFQLIIVLVIALLVFGGRGKISSIMGDLANGMKSFRQGLKDDEESKEPAPKSPKALEDGETINITPKKDKTEV
ncbi:twin-arginine translocase TatA/TatE family subunit [Hirschia baltica]|uniref:Sec-independent protein translocase protein TatA n=1 Tax=Hirschia baltica (strain ATCC 49814 / DSM 5838 / IFAM 1418) TaxID=582402 RepID=C6XIZ3_HIRBI|nr:twin-arginine translocase TatA/TatE family subunit [Hirschia baltica]ACT59088.1 twin-arginine translocation protein, TatA/E family subunit [Hirschia baltica ATCC 49814]